MKPNNHDARLDALGAFRPAGQRALELALDRADRSSSDGRIPIAGAAVLQHPDFRLDTVAVGTNGRIPGANDNPKGYPTDHGETAAIRRIENVRAVDWRSVVFATTLSPCTMCSRTLAFLHELGLNKVVIAESESFPGTKERLKALPGMTVVELEDPQGIAAMQRFATEQPDAWAADIGELTPCADLRERLQRVTIDSWRQSLQGPRASTPTAMVFHLDGTPGPELLSTATDGREVNGDNPTQSAIMRALGLAGSTINLRECVVVFRVNASGPIDLATFGHASLGACELFRPAAIVTAAPFFSTLRKPLTAAGIHIIEVDT